MEQIYVFTVDSSTGYDNLYAPIYNLGGYKFDMEGDEDYIRDECV
jgi:hypothetical protein